MTRWLVAFALSAAIAAQADAQSAPIGALLTKEAEAAPKPKVDFRLVRDPDFDSTPVHQSGVIAQTHVSENATLGIGMLRVTPRQPVTGEWRNLPPNLRSKKAAVKFTLKF